MKSPIPSYLKSKILPLLSRDEERDLFTQLRSHPPDSPEYRDIADRIVRSNIPMVIRIAGRFPVAPLSPLTFDEVLAAGLNGLRHAIGVFRLERGTRFATHATPWIRRCIAVDRGESHAIRVPKWVRDAIHKVESVAMDKRECVQAGRAIMAMHDASHYRDAFHHGDGGAGEHCHVVEGIACHRAGGPDDESAESGDQPGHGDARFSAILALLDDGDRDILYGRLQGATYETMARELGVAINTVRARYEALMEDLRFLAAMDDVDGYGEALRRKRAERKARVQAANAVAWKARMARKRAARADGVGAVVHSGC